MNKFSLDKNPKITDGFNVPEHYFNDLSSDILLKIKEKKPEKPKVFSLKTISYVAAAILILALSLPFFRTNSNLSFEDIETNVLENYISYQSTFSSYDIITLLDTDELDEIQVDLALEDQTLEDILTSNPNFENYILE